MNTLRVRTVIGKEWAEVFKNRLVLFTVGLLPLLFTALPLIVLYSTRGASANSGDMADLPPSFFELCGDIAAGDCLQFYVLSQFLILFMMMPLIIPVSIAAYSIVGEKTTRSLEPLLATPISTVELLTAKGLAAAIPAVLATWIAYAVFVALAPLAGASAAVWGRLVSPTWLVAVFLLGPLMAVLSVNFAVMVSSRVSDPRVAEQLAAVVIVPLLVILFAQLAGVIVLNLAFMFIAALVLAAADVGLVFVGARLFQRETILTKWK
jgi:ABC-2 type transport system permease protein